MYEIKRGEESGRKRGVWRKKGRWNQGDRRRPTWQRRPAWRCGGHLCSIPGARGGGRRGVAPTVLHPSSVGVAAARLLVLHPGSGRRGGDPVAGSGQRDGGPAARFGCTGEERDWEERMGGDWGSQLGVPRGLPPIGGGEIFVSSPFFVHLQKRTQNRFFF
jgi:hypothetical protein